MGQSIAIDQEAGVTMGDDGPGAGAPPRPKPTTTIVVPPRGSADSFFTYGLGGIESFSPGPMTLVSSFFSEQSPCSFLSHTLDGGGDVVDEKKDTGGAGYKRNRPATLVVAPPPSTAADSLSQLLMIPPGMTPSGLLASPGFISPLPLQSPFAMSHQQALAFVTAQAAASSEPCNSTQADDALTTHPLENTSFADTETEALKIESSEGSIKAVYGSAGAGNSGSNDGYNWRKYGQKNVKASECPRSYYRCSHLNCPVRKKVETAIDGSVSEIIYKGQHIHDPPPPQQNRRGKDYTQSTLESDSIAPPQRLPGNNNNNENEDPVIVSSRDDEEEDLPDPKRRSMEIGQLAPRTSTEYKIVVQTRSEVDLLDDGYRWRKYGQKIVKGKTHPRSYYRCTYAGCNVRKQVERASSDTKAVITTYEGKHNHDIPTGKYSSNQGDPSNAKPQNTASRNPSRNRVADSTGNDDRPATLCLKEEQIAA